MAKNQNLTLNYSKLNGVCGQLKCCLQYEDEVYNQKRKKLPHEGSFIETINGDKGKIFRLHILSEQFDLLTEKGKIKRYTTDYFKARIKPQDVKMPDRFDNISDETSTVIGLTELESKKAASFEREMVKLKQKAGKYASEVFEELTGIGAQDQQETPQQKEAKQEKEMLSKEKRFQAKEKTWTPAPTEQSAPSSELDKNLDGNEVSQRPMNASSEEDKGDRRGRNNPKKPGRPRRGNRNRRRGPRKDNKTPK